MNQSKLNAMTESANEDKKIVITKQQALKVIAKPYHIFRNPATDLIVGFDANKAEIIKIIHEADIIEMSGKTARNMKHGIVAINKTHSGHCFIATNEKRLLALEAKLTIEKKPCAGYGKKLFDTPPCL